jgi:hypothetical protein
MNLAEDSWLAAEVRVFDDLGKQGYAGSMDNKILFVQSAFKHGITEVDIYWAFETFIFEDPVDDGTDNKFLLIGFDAKGNPLVTATDER